MAERRRAQDREIAPYPRTGLEDVVRHERERSLRHNHFFAVMGLQVDEDQEGFGLQRVREIFRASDMVCLVAQKNGASSTTKPFLGILLPETDRKGAEVAVRRIQGETGMMCRMAGMAVFPEDGTEIGDLLKLVFASR